MNEINYNNPYHLMGHCGKPISTDKKAINVSLPVKMTKKTPQCQLAWCQIDVSCNNMPNFDANQPQENLETCTKHCYLQLKWTTTHNIIK